MQAKDETWRDFLRRTDTLAVALGLDIGDLPGRLGVSRASLFRYRSGKSPISAKAWIKLAFAETDAGIVTPLEQILEKAIPHDGMAGAIKSLMDRGDWNENLDGQLRAFLGQRIFGRSILTTWSVIEDLAGAFFDKVQEAVDTQRKIASLAAKAEGSSKISGEMSKLLGIAETLASGLAQDLPTLRNQLANFGEGLETFIERADQAESIE